MRLTLALLAFVIAAALARGAHAFPDGAPWGAANPAADQSCATCHFGSDPIVDSQALSISGLPEFPSAKEVYELVVALDDPQSVIAGFQLLAQAGSEQAGSFESQDGDVEIIGSSIRSTAPIRAEERQAWTFQWRIPDDAPDGVVFLVAATAANDDGSPFGDTIHFRAYKLAPD